MLTTIETAVNVERLFTGIGVRAARQTTPGRAVSTVEHDYHQKTKGVV